MATATASGIAVYDELMHELRETAITESISALVGWDQETYQPDKAADLKADQIRQLSELLHARQTSPRLGERIAACEQDTEVMADDIRAANIREIRTDYDRETKLPADLVAEIAECGSRGMQAWRAAREHSDFNAFLPWLKKTVELNQRKADCLTGTPGTGRYDALMDTYEPNMKSARVHELFTPLREKTVELLEVVRSSTNPPDFSIREEPADIAMQRELCHKVMDQVGFDFDAGRFDDTTHPFCSGFGPGDTRLTNRFRSDGWADALSGAMHEGGHGVYEQGLPKSQFMGQPLGTSVSLGMHESQSRLWENQVGRSLNFQHWMLPIIQSWGGRFASTSAEELYRAANVVRPSFIRVEADEVTYNLHIMLRFDFERAMIEGDMDPQDLPALWNERFEKDFGLKVPEDRLGCLQDVHWSMTAMGYFPTYTLGNMYAAAWWAQMQSDIPNRDDLIKQGDFAPILQWTRTNIHEHGRRYPAEQLCERITGKPLQAQPLIDYLHNKVHAVYS